jgi:hypothetical protein
VRPPRAAVASVAGELVDGAVQLGDRFGVVFVLCVAVAIAAVTFAILAVRTLWTALQAKEAAHAVERKADRDVHLAALERLGSGLEGGLERLGKQIDRVEARVEDLARASSSTRAA